MEPRDPEPDLEEVPDPLEAQLPLIRESLTALGIPILGVAEHEADDVIGTLAATSTIPVDIVTGDRDLFQLIDDERRVRVIYTARGMSKLEVVSNDTLISKYGVRAEQYADFATLRGDASDGLPGVTGVGDKTAATLLSNFEDLATIRAAAADETSEMAAGLRAKINAAADYLEVAPRVVSVAKNLAVVAPSEPLRAPNTNQRAAAVGLAERHNLGSSMARALEALKELGD